MSLYKIYHNTQRTEPSFLAMVRYPPKLSSGGSPGFSVGPGFLGFEVKARQLQTEAKLENGHTTDTYQPRMTLGKKTKT